MEPKGLRRFGAAGGALLGAVLAAACSTAGADTTDVPTFVVDATWPEPLEYPQILGAITGVAVDARDHVFVVQRQDAFNSGNEISAATEIVTGECCVPAPAILEFDPAGNLVRGFGGESAEYVWFERPHGIAVDPQGNVWVGGSGAPASTGGGRGGRGGGGGGGGQPAQPDTHILKFGPDGSYLATIGTPNAGGPNSASTTSFGGPARIAFDADANEAYVADGYFNRRVVVLDMTTGAVKRSWGAYGNAPSDEDIGEYDPAAPPAQQFRVVTCAVPSNDGLVYVCDRGNNRIQVFESDGTYVTEKIIAPNTRGATAGGLLPGRGSVWDIAFSPDDDQRYMYVADGMNERVYILDRETLEVRTSFGTGGRYPSHFLALSSLGVDSQGNVYTGEDEEGKRVQKFVHTGIGPVTAEHQGAVWPNP